jgi:hypothetical protein
MLLTSNNVQQHDGSKFKIIIKLQISKWHGCYGSYTGNRSISVSMYIFGSSLPPVVCRMTRVFLTLFVFICV